MEFIEMQKQIQGVYDYIYDIEDENKFTGKINAQLDPLASKEQGKPVFLTPPNSTQKEPPKVKDGEIALFNTKKGNWEVVKDCKDKKYWDEEKQEVVVANKHRDDTHIFFTEDEEKELILGKSVKIVKGKYVFYWSDKQCIDRIIRETNDKLLKTDFYFYRDYPVEKVPSLMGNYREYLRTINSEHNLKDKDVQNLQVLTYEEFINL